MDANYNLHQQLLQQQLYYSQQTNVTIGDAGSDQRLSQWSIQEVRDFLMIRAEIDLKFMGTKRNKLLWEAITTRMNELGYNRNHHQCKCKWKNLVATYKECETVEGQGLLMQQQFPFYNELQSIFGMRMERMLWMESESGGSGSRNKMIQLYSDEEEDDDEDEEILVADKKGAGKSAKKKAKVIKGNMDANPSINTTSGNNNDMKVMLDGFFKKQLEMDMQWMRAMEAREEEKKRRDMEWKEKMEKLEKERIVMEKERREREEEWRMRDEARAEKRDALIDKLLNKLIREEEEEDQG